MEKWAEHSVMIFLHQKVKSGCYHYDFSISANLYLPTSVAGNLGSFFPFLKKSHFWQNNSRGRELTKGEGCSILFFGAAKGEGGEGMVAAE